MARKKKISQENNCTLKISKRLRSCTVVLYDIALETDLIQRYQLHLPLKKETLLKQSASYINTSIHSTNKRLLKKNVQKKNAIENEKYTIRNCSKKIVSTKKRKDYKKIESQQNGKDIEVNKNISLSHQYGETIPSKLIPKRQQLTRHTNVELLSSKNTDETSSTSSITHFNYMQKMTQLMNNENHKNVRKPNIKNRSNSKRALHSNKPDVTNDADIKPTEVDCNDTNCLDKKNLTVTNYNSNMQEISSKSITHTQCDNNLHPVNFSDGTNCKVLEEYKKNQNSKDGVVQTTCKGEMSPRNNIKKSGNNIKKSVEIRQNLPKIIGNYVLSKGIKVLKGVKVERLKTNNSLDSSIPEQISLEQDRYNNNNKNSDQTSHINDTAETTNVILREKEKHTSLEINGSINILKSTLPLNNNVDLKDKSIPNNKAHSKLINYRNLNSLTKVRNNDYNYIDINNTDSETAMMHENCTLNHQEQLSRFTSNIEVHENNALQGNKKCEERRTKNILNKNISNLMDIDDESNSTLLISANKKGAIKQTRKRTLEENDKDCNLGSKKIKLNRNSWLQNNVTSNSINQQWNSSNIGTFFTTDTTVELNISKEHNHEKKIDLRKHLDQMKSKKIFKLNSTVETENEEFCKKLSLKEESTLNNTLYEKKNNAQKEHTNVLSDNEDDDCISLFAESFLEFTSQCEDKFECEKDKSCKSPYSDVPYTMTASSFDKFMKQNNNEFDKEYAEYIEDNTEALKSNKVNEVSNNQLTQTLNADCIPATAIKTEPKLLEIRNICPQNLSPTLYNFTRGYCFLVLKNGTCHRYLCRFKHNLKDMFDTIETEDSKIILNIIPEALRHNFNYFCEGVYINLLKKLTIDQILITYKMLYDISNSYLRREFTTVTSKNIANNLIRELYNRHMPLKVIFDRMMTHILPTNNLNELYNIIMSVKKYVKSDEYWNIVRNLILKLEPDVCGHIVDRILYECIRSKELQYIQDVNSNLINKLDSTIISTLNKYKCFKSMLDEKTAENSYFKVPIQNFGESLTTETIASPDSPDPSQNMNFIQQESSTRYDTFISENDSNQSENITRDVNLTKPYIYGFLQSIDAPCAQSVYRDHERFWKFFMNLERFEKGLMYEDYDYVIDILKSYNTKKRERELFVSKCSLVLRKVKRSEFHLRNILRLTVQKGTFSILDKILFDIGLDILANLVDEEAWGLALELIQSLNIYDLPYNAEYFLLSAEIYLANKKAMKACNLLKYRNIICTSRNKWFVKSTINDEHVRNKIIYILLDSFCNEFLEHAFFLFQFLLKDQSSYYNPIDLSRYVDKLIILSLLKMDTNLITEMGQLVLKHSFALSTTTCRALISTIIHTDEVLARQLYIYAEGIGIYSAVKLLPVVHIIINTDLTEEEIYLIFLQLLKNLIMSFGHAIEFAKPHQIKVYYILEIKSTEQFYCAALQSHYNNQAIMKAKTLIRSVLKKRFDPPLLLMSNVKGRIGKLQSTSLINYLKSEHCN